LEAEELRVRAVGVAAIKTKVSRAHGDGGDKSGVSPRLGRLEF
jgi:hypothetical protein